jgi:hypothetical protein
MRVYREYSVSLFVPAYRYFAVTKPLEYHMATVTSGPWRRVANYMVPTVVFSILFNTPKFLELEQYQYDTEDADDFNSTVVDFRPTALRLNQNYSFYYVHLTRLFITGIIPFGALVFLNLSIYRYFY